MKSAYTVCVKKQGTKEHTREQLRFLLAHAELKRFWSNARSNFLSKHRR
jgi:ethanolamine ammonia-lyase small subunit